MNLTGSYDPSGVSVTKQDPEITRWLKTLGERIEHLDKVVELMTKHLNPVLTPLLDTPPDIEKAVNPQPGLSPLAETLREFDRRIRVATDVLEHTDTRLEI